VKLDYSYVEDLLVKTSRSSNCIECGVLIESGERGPLRKRCDLHRKVAHFDAATRFRYRKVADEVLSGSRVLHCVVCGKEFVGKQRAPSSRKRICSEGPCLREWKWFQNWGVPFGTYERLYLEQQGNCALCGKHRSVLRLDHCHTTGKVRGLLCNACNGALGQLGDNQEGLSRALSYVTRA
jgi:hypothetical protein